MTKGACHPVVKFVSAEREGFARDSNARRRSHLVWAPPHRNFLLKISAPAFESLYLGIVKKGT